MNHMSTLKRIALSSLLLSAVATPTYFANASTEPITKNIASSVPSGETSAYSVTSSIVAVPFADPLKLAEKYAPDTVNDWKTTLDKLAELTPVYAATTRLTIGEVSDSAIPGETLNKLNVSEGKLLTISSNDDIAYMPLMPVVGKSISLKDVKITNVESADTVTFKSENGLASAIAVEATQLIPVNGTIDMKTVKITNAEWTSTDVIKSENGVTAAVAVEATFNSSFQKLLELDKAVKSEDAATIKQALAELLDMYKQQIEQLTEK
ncbi:hypothetical protein D3C73_762840 [compost metagenome]